LVYEFSIRVFIELHLINALEITVSTLFPCNHVSMHGLFNKFQLKECLKMCIGGVNLFCDWTDRSLFILWQNSSSINHHWIDRDYLWSFSTGRLIAGEQYVIIQQSPIPSHSEEPLGNGVRSFFIISLCSFEICWCHIFLILPRLL